MDIEKKILTALRERPGHSATISDLVTRLGIDQSLIMVSAQNLREKGLVTIKEEYYQELARGKEWQEGFPERLALEKIAGYVGNTGELELAQLPLLLNKEDVRSLLKWLTKRGWLEREGNRIRLTEKGKRAVLGELDADEKINQELKDKEAVTSLSLKKGFTDEEIETGLKLLQGRESLVRIKRRTLRILTLTPAGIEQIREKVEVKEEPATTVTQITPELLASGRWRTVQFRAYDVTLPTKPKFIGKAHPLSRIIQKARRAFLEMGFEEVSSPVVETAFWDFDALFQPQDHPAREMQDTFYVALPNKAVLPQEEILQRVALTHENGWETGSRGWRYKWDRTEAEKLLLRTHTTAATIRALAENPNPPRKVFCIGKVFRRENMDATHLPEFIQIDGIVIDESASLVTLFGTLTEFYRKMGAKQVRFRPSYFPYTEPSVEVFANLGRLGWVEMGGAGVFRQEVVKPFGCRTRVLAWGLGLERVAMMRYGVQDIRKLYWADINWLRMEAKLRMDR